MLRALITCCIGSIGYLLLAGTVSRAELATAAALGCIAALWSRLVGRASDRSFAFSGEHARAWLRAFGGLPRAVVSTGAALFRVLLRDSAAAWRADLRPFRYGSVDDPAERARRATAVLAASLAPASFIVRAEPDREAVLVHGISSVPSQADSEWLA